jgi:hypothetical protein
LNARKAVLAVLLITLLVAFIVFAFDRISTSRSIDFHVGVEFAYSSNLNDSQIILRDLEALVDKVKNYTNLFVIGAPQVSLNQTLLTQSCDYISNASLDFIVLYTDTTKYDYNLREWTTNAQQSYGDKFLGVYRIDEPGGKELENATVNGVSDRFLNPKEFDPAVRNYTGAADEYVTFLKAHLDLIGERLYPKIFTSDFGLYWFDYMAGYETVFAEFVWNQSRETAIALCRGAAVAQGKDWGIIVTWMYDKEPYIESGQQLYTDLVLAYRAGAKYAVIFDYPNVTDYGILKEEHFEALQNFWSYAQSNQQEFGANQGKVAYVLPAGYGFGFRNPGETIWGIWNADDLSPKVFNDVNTLINKYSSSFDIVYDDPEYMAAITNRYGKLLFWNETIAAD